MRQRGRFISAALTLAILVSPLAGCDRAEKPAAPAPRGEIEVDAIEAEYEACRTAGDGDALISCADTAFTAAAPDVDNEAVAALGDAAIEQAGGDYVAARVVAAEAMARFAFDRARVRQGRPLIPAEERAVPALLAKAGAPIVAGTCTGSRVVDACRAAHDRLLPRLAARVTEPGMIAAVPGGYVPPTCQAVRAASSADAALGQFESDFPAALKDEKLVETVVLSDGQVRGISAYLACLAERTDYAPDVVESSLTFFASGKSGARAREALAILGKGGGQDATAAREFADQVEDFLTAPAG